MKRIVLLAIAVAAAACTAAPPADREVRLARLAAEQRQLMEKLEDLQARLLVNRQRVRFWQEMQERHASVSAIACSSQETHAVAMAERLLPQEPKPELRARRRQVASIHAGAERATPARR